MRRETMALTVASMLFNCESGSKTMPLPSTFLTIKKPPSLSRDCCGGGKARLDRVKIMKRDNQPDNLKLIGLLRLHGRRKMDH